jgi:tRNA threonylcarbamoyladenosine biosynthesis protein TsaB
MNLLAIDTSTDTASVALLRDSELFCEEQTNQRAHAQFILPMIDKLMSKANFQMQHLDAVVFGCGPGSFTGLRIACSIAKGIGFAHDLPLIPVSSLVTIAWLIRQQKQCNLPVVTILDARMQEVYWSYFAKDEWKSEEHVNSVEEINLPEKQSLILAGVGIDLYWDKFTKAFKSQVIDTLAMQPNAKAMIEFVLYSELEPISAGQAQPVYVRNKVT